MVKMKWGNCFSPLSYLEHWENGKHSSVNRNSLRVCEGNANAPHRPLSIRLQFRLAIMCIQLTASWNVLNTHPAITGNVLRNFGQDYLAKHYSSNVNRTFV